MCHQVHRRFGRTNRNAEQTDTGERQNILITSHDGSLNAKIQSLFLIRPMKKPPGGVIIPAKKPRARRTRRSEHKEGEGMRKEISQAIRSFGACPTPV